MFRQGWRWKRGAITKRQKEKSVHVVFDLYKRKKKQAKTKDEDQEASHSIWAVRGDRDSASLVSPLYIISYRVPRIDPLPFFLLFFSFVLFLLFTQKDLLLLPAAAVNQARALPVLPSFLPSFSFIHLRRRPPPFLPLQQLSAISQGVTR